MNIKKEIYFEASPAKAWDLLTNPEQTRQYMFGCQVLSDWTPGSPILWQGQTEDGHAIVYVKGTIQAIESGQKVSFTMFDPNMGLEDIPENYVTLTYKLTPQNTGTLLTLIQGDYTTVANSQSRYEESLKGWDMVLPLMKAQVEK